VADNILLIINAATKTDFGVSVSRQWYAGSLFEQFTLFILEGFMTLWQSQN
jgi:6-phospho-3-hexuloisomerase